MTEAIDYGSPGSQLESERLAPGRGTAWMQRIERAEWLDHPVDGLGRIVDPLFRARRVNETLRGAWFGHALHPLLTDFPLGSWLSASLLDLFGGRRSKPAATGLVAFGVAMTLPTAAAGLAEWRAADRVSRRVGLVHATLNTAVTICYAASLAARLRGRHRRGVMFALAGGGGAWVSGYLGGHLSLVRKIGTADPAFRERSLLPKAGQGVATAGPTEPAADF